VSAFKDDVPLGWACSWLTPTGLVSLLGHLCCIFMFSYIRVLVESNVSALYALDRTDPDIIERILQREKTYAVVKRTPISLLTKLFSPSEEWTGS
jgi:hypothetical protein